MKSKIELVLLLIIVSLSIMMLGVTSNIVVLDKNNCKMPFIANYIYEDGTHISFNMDQKPELWYLSDIIKIGRRKISVGDVLMWGGFVALIIFSSSYIYLKSKE